ncbi:hypothetical protein SARC_08938 [Sphaeroforma arctica JP610]|uniref:Uncharacterized protein n=1 Tax=Sphaeroforma arctica JP610 TaxID=667725 RepID=A0A0L0FPA8_9EUKA|nr:hypothetical protein SARC_08938 [Sphaeroforma arctica JP610]KNC78640.1 hypothetical protein SARC_08938 [Sphaeroforma arctica JP610]|eukprot:XP_014152542.1 hypothetical protein SARC_08938 [Sphaeroforma arctica JP610]
MISMGGTVINITSLCVATFRGPKANARAMQMARYGNALTHQCFYSISKVDNIDYLVHKNMITDEEGQLIRNFRGKKTNLIASWLLDTLEMARHEQMAADDNCGVDAQETMEMIFIIRGKASKLQELQKLPPPLSYYHFLVVTLYSWLLLLAYSTPYLPERNSRVWLSFLCYFVVLFSYMGLIATAFAHVDPWGTDTSDIDVLTRLDGTLRQSQLICEDKFHAAKRDLEPPTTPFNSEILENPALKYRTVAEEEQAQEAKENHNNLPSILQVLRKRSTLVDKYCQTNDMSELGGLVLEHHRPSSPSFKDHPANQSTSVDVPTNKKEPVKLVQQQPKERQCTILR